MVEENRPSDQPPTPPPGEPVHGTGPTAPPPGGLQHPEVRYERTDASFRWIFGIIVGSGVLMAVIYYVVLLFFQDYQDYQAAIKSSNFPLGPSGSEPLPPQPRLEQINRMAEIERGNVYLRQEQKETILSSYGPVEEGYVHIPIDRAMDLLANKLPVRTTRPSAAQARRQNGLVNAG